jgi:ABC-2 type transport system ATP-binding protein
MAEGQLLVTDTPEGLRRRALGGEVVDLKTAERLDYARVQLLRNLPFVLEGKVDRIGDTEVQIVVDEASTAMPALVEWSKDQNLTIESIQEYLPPFDDVFVSLVKGYSNNG